LGDKVTAFVVRADSEDQARSLASHVPRSEVGFVWLDAKLTTCVELSQNDRDADGDAGVVMADSRADWLSACCAASTGLLR